MTRAEALRILGLQPDATPSEIKRAYRQLVKAVHPDKNSAPNARHLFQLVQEAYEFISAEERREQTREQANREARDRAEREAREARARAAREWAEREARQREKREKEEKEAKERADRNRKAREAKEKAAKEAEARNEWKRQRREAVTGIEGSMGGCLFAPMMFISVAGFIALIRLGVAISRNGWWIFATIVVAFIVFSVVLVVLFGTLDEYLKKRQLKKFMKNHPPPSKNTTGESQENIA